jgi:hypothetical protein
MEITLIGAGDAMVNRIIPALFFHGLKRDQLHLLTIDEGFEPKGVEKLIYAERLKSTQDIIERAKKLANPIIVASPTSSHFDYIKAFSLLDIPFAIEKPLVAAPKELKALSYISFERVFALSNYTLDKALPLTWLLDPKPIYESFLEGETTESLDALEGLGKLVRIEMDLLEDASRSPRAFNRLWTEMPAELYTFVETAIHPLVVFRHLVSEAISWQSAISGIYGPRLQEVEVLTGKLIAPSFIEAHGLSESGVKLRMRVGKHIPTSLIRRGLSAEFEKGKIICNFDNRDMVVRNDQDIYRVSLKEELPNYGAQIGLFLDFLSSGAYQEAKRLDDLLAQLSALKDWEELCNLEIPSPRIYNDEDAREMLREDPSVPLWSPGAGSSPLW